MDFIVLVHIALFFLKLEKSMFIFYFVNQDVRNGHLPVLR